MRSPLYINQSLERGSQACDFLSGEKFTVGESHGLLTWDLVWEFLSKNSQCIARDIIDCRHCDSCRFGVGKFDCVYASGKNTDIESDSRSICFLYSLDADSCTVIHRLLRCAQPLTGDSNGCVVMEQNYFYLYYVRIKYCGISIRNRSCRNLKCTDHTERSKYCLWVD